MIAVVPVRDGQLPLGADEVVAEVGGTVLLVGRGTREAAEALAHPHGGVPTPAGAGRRLRVRTWEAGTYAAGTWARALGPLLAAEPSVLLPGSPDGRDLAPRLAAVLGRPLLAGAISMRPDRAVLARRNGLVCEEVVVDVPVVATLQPGARGVEAAELAGVVDVQPLELALPAGHDAEVLEVLPPDPATMDLREARRILAGGAGLSSPADFALLGRVAGALGASMGATRVVADIGWVDHDRYIGTTGVAVDPDLYVAFGISGAVQHVTGLGHPDHVVSVNLDPSCPMSAMADLALVTDAGGLLRELARRLGVELDADEAAGGSSGSAGGAGRAARQEAARV